MTRRGRPPHPGALTRRQREVWTLVRQGCTNEEIAERLGISIDGAKWHVSEIISRLGVTSRHEAALVEDHSRRWWAGALAPLALFEKLKLHSIGYALGAAVVAGGAVAVALLLWGVVSVGKDSDHSVATERTGMADVDRTIDLLVRQDLDGLMALVSFLSLPCSIEQTIGSPPPCPAGTPDGTPVDAFPLGSCEGYYATSPDDVRVAFGASLLRQPSAAVYAVMRGGAIDGGEGYTVAITPDMPSQPTAPVSLWHLSDDGRIQGLINECGPTGAAQRIEQQFGSQPPYVVGPFVNCSPPPGDTANVIVAVDSVSPGGIRPQFSGRASSTVGSDLGERAIVLVTAATLWTGAIDRLEDVRTGMELQAVGVRQDDCTIEAQTILTPSDDTLADPRLGITFEHPFNWHEGAAPMPYASCVGCLVLGPEQVQYPYGVSIFESQPSPGCTAACYCSIRCISPTGPISPSDAIDVKVGGLPATQIELRRQPPLDGSGETALYAEIWTVLQLDKRALVIIGFFREGDPAAETYVRRAYPELLRSIVLAPVVGTPTP
jgi:DNA-binding CsgD family transcriptional regulator